MNGRSSGQRWPGLYRAPSGWLRQLALPSLALLVCGGVVLQGCSTGTTGRASGGRIAWSSAGQVWVLDLETHQATRMASPPPPGGVTGVAWAPDGQRLAYAWRGPGGPEHLAGSDIVQVNADGSEPSVVAAREAAEVFLDTPTWTRSGQLYYTRWRYARGSEGATIVRQAASAAPHQTVIEDGFYPAVAPDEATIVFVRHSQQGDELWKQALNSGPACVLVGGAPGQLLGVPRISPDGQRVAFGASGIGAGQGGTCQASSVRAVGPPPAPGAWSLATWLGLGPVTAWAHGLPWDIWVVGLDGSGLTRLTDLTADDLNLAWAPDGTSLAVLSSQGLYVVDGLGGRPRQVLDRGGSGALDWTA